MKPTDPYSSLVDGHSSELYLAQEEDGTLDSSIQLYCSVATELEDHFSCLDIWPSLEKRLNLNGAVKPKAAKVLAPLAAMVFIGSLLIGAGWVLLHPISVPSLVKDSTPSKESLYSDDLVSQVSWDRDHFQLSVGQLDLNYPAVSIQVLLP